MFALLNKQTHPGMRGLREGCIPWQQVSGCAAYQGFCGEATSFYPYPWLGTAACGEGSEASGTWGATRACGMQPSPLVNVVEYSQRQCNSGLLQGSKSGAFLVHFWAKVKRQNVLPN